MSTFSDWFQRTLGLPTAPPLAPADPPPAPSAPEAYDYMIELEKLIASREGRDNTVYLDTKGILTVGIGHRVLPEDHLKKGDVISDEFVDAYFRKDSAGALHAALLQMQEAGITDQHFIPYLTSVCFQLGNAWTKNFLATWDLICVGEYEAAAARLSTTLWAHQTPVRVADFQGALRRLPPKVPA